MASFCKCYERVSLYRTVQDVCILKECEMYTLFSDKAKECANANIWSDLKICKNLHFGFKIPARPVCAVKFTCSSTPPLKCKHTLVSFVSAPCQGYLRVRGDRQEEESLASGVGASVTGFEQLHLLLVSFLDGQEGSCLDTVFPTEKLKWLKGRWAAGEIRGHPPHEPSQPPSTSLSTSPQENFLLLSSGSRFPLKAARQMQRPNAKITRQAVSPIPERFLWHTQREHLPDLEPESINIGKKHSDCSGIICFCTQPAINLFWKDRQNNCRRHISPW